MDCGSVYIKMCEKAEDVQKIKGQFALVGGDMYAYSIAKKLIWGGSDWHDDPKSKDRETQVAMTYGTGDYYDVCPGKYIAWLPRQDQLQEMAKGDLRDKLLRFHSFWFGHGFLEEPRVFFTMEQLWLAFLMKERYNKIWDDKEWVEK